MDFTLEYERSQLDTLSDRELVSYWNICTMNAGMLGGDKECNARHAGICKELLAERGIVAEDGKLLKAVAA